MRVCLYQRISTDEDHQPTSLRTQHERLERYCEAMEDWHIVAAFEDQASGTSLDRPGLQQALDLAREKRIDLLLVYRVDRLSRKVRQLAGLCEELDQLDVVLKSATEPFDTGSAAGRMMLQMLGVFAEFEHATIVDRVTAGLERRVREGKWMSGRIPYGYTRDKETKLLIPGPVKAPVVRRIFHLYAEGKLGTTAIARTLDAEGAPPPRKQGWSPNALQLILANPAYRGLVRWNGETHPGLHEPLVDEETFEAAQEILRRRGEDASLRRGNPSDFLLSGLVRCDHCDRAYVGTSAHGRNGRYTYYACSTRYKYGPSKCNGDRLPKDRLEAAVLAQLADLYRDGNVIEQALADAARHVESERPRVEEQLASARAEIRRLEAKLERYFEAFEDGTLSPADCQDRVRAHRARLETLREQEADLTHRLGTEAHTPPDTAALAGLADQLEDIVANESPEQAKELLRLLVKEIRVHDRRQIIPTYRIPAAVRAIPRKVGGTGLEPASPRLHASPLRARIALFAGTSSRVAERRLRPSATFCGFSCGHRVVRSRCFCGKRSLLAAPRVHMRLRLSAVRRGRGMLSVAKLTLGQEAYYERQVARGLDDYYAGRGESPGIWAGTGSAGLGLVGVVGDDDLGTVLRGVNPANAQRLRSPVRERTITRRRLDVETGEWREEPAQLKPVSGYDLVFSCPKSVSLLHALTDEESVRREISEAHEKAWQSALGYLERKACIVRRGKGGTIREHGEGFVAAAFRHRTSRAQDPHLHTHIVVANMTRTADGEWRALDGEAILTTYRLAAGYLYEAHLRHELTHRLGVEWTEPVKGMGELRSVPDETIRAFSTRRLSLVERMEALGTDGFTASRVAALATREAKEQIDLPRLRKDWKARAAEHGLGLRELEALRRHRPVARDRVELEQLAARVLGPEGLTEKQTTFTTPELVQAVAGALPTGASVDEVLELAQELSRFPGVEFVEAQEAPGRPARFTTRELLAVEREAIELALAGRNVPVPAPERRPLAEALMSTGHELTGEQRMLVHEAACRSDRVVCVVGVAGSGKTLALRALADAYCGIDVTILGAAPSGRAADELQTATGISSRTLHRLLLDAQHNGGLPHHCVLVLDEAGMAETRILAPLLHAIERAEGKLLLVGDPAQLPAVGAGGLYQALCDRLDVIELSGNRRQRDPLEREALARLRHGDPEPYLAHAARHHRLAVDDNSAIVKERLLADWWQEARRSPTRNVMLAYRRSDVDDLNQAAHALMLRNRRLGGEAVTLGEREYRIGEQVLCRKNDARLGLRNGMRGTIVDLDERSVVVRDRSGVNRYVTSSYATEHLDYGYALTGHAAQGITVDRAFVVFPDQGALKEWGYVACTRARLQTRLYLADRDALERETPLRESDPAAPPERTARALERSSAEPLALDQRREARDTILNFLGQQREKLERDRERTSEQLAAAERELEQLHWWKRDRRAELQSEITLHHKTLARANHSANQLRRDAELRSERLAQRSKTLALARERDELTPSLEPERARRSPAIKRDREPPGRGLEL